MEKLTIKELINLNPEKFIRAGMVTIIIFLAAGWGATIVNDRNERIETAKQNEVRRRKDADQIIDLYNILIREAKQEYLLMDSSRRESIKTIENIGHILEKLKR